jgi:hypothetical protein
MPRPATGGGLTSCGGVFRKEALVARSAKILDIGRHGTDAMCSNSRRRAIGPCRTFEREEPSQPGGHGVG